MNSFSTSVKLVLAVLSVFILSLLQGCGGGGGGTTTPTSTVVGKQMGGAREGVDLGLSSASATVSTFAGGAPNVDGIGAAARFSVPQFTATDGTNLYVTECGVNSLIRKVVIATGATTTLAGSDSGVSGATDGTGTAATFNCPLGITTDGTNLYVADSSNNKIREISPASGSTLSTMTSATANVTSLTGAANTATTAGAQDGTATGASFSNPADITTDGTNLYVVDRNNNKIREISPASGSTLSTMTSATANVISLTGAANTATTAGAKDGAATGASFSLPVGITTDGTNLYVADFNNNKIREISPVSGSSLSNMTSATANVTSLTGTANTATTAGATDGAATVASFVYPAGITTDGTNLYVTDFDNNKIREISPVSGSTLSTMTSATANVISLTGTANTKTTAGATDGPATVASFNFPVGITTDNIKLYVVDSSNNNIRQVVITTGAVSTLAGGAPDANGIGAAARFNSPRYTATDGTNLYVTECGVNSLIRKVVIATGATTTLAGSDSGVSGATDGTGTAATFNCPLGITTDGTNLYVADYGNNKIREISPASGYTLSSMISATANVTSLTGAASTTTTAGATDGTATGASFSLPVGITTDGTNLYVVDSSNNKIREISPASGYTLSSMTSATANVTSLTGAASTTTTAGATDGTATGASFSFPVGITTDGINLYVVDSSNSKIREISPVSGYTLSSMTSATANVTSLTGTANAATTAGATDGTATGASFNLPRGITTDGTNLYVADNGNNKIREISPVSGSSLSNMTSATANVTSLTGTANAATTAGATDGTASGVSFKFPVGITTDGISLYVVDDGNSNIRKIK